jgi:hypothetical protein
LRGPRRTKPRESGKGPALKPVAGWKPSRVRISAMKLLDAEGKLVYEWSFVDAPRTKPSR